MQWLHFHLSAVCSPLPPHLPLTPPPTLPPPPPPPPHLLPGVGGDGANMQGEGGEEGADPGGEGGGDREADARLFQIGAIYCHLLPPTARAPLLLKQWKYFI